MIQQVHSWTYNLRRQNWKDTGREICTAQYDKSQDMGSNQKVHQRMGGHRRTPPYTDGIFASEKNETMPFAAP